MSQIDEVKELYETMSVDDQLTFFSMIGQDAIKNAVLAEKSYEGLSKQLIYGLMKTNGFIDSLKFTDDEMFIASLNFDANLIIRVRDVNKARLDQWFDRWSTTDKDYFREKVQLLSTDVAQETYNLLYSRYHHIMDEDQVCVLVRQFPDIADTVINSETCTDRMLVEYVFSSLYKHIDMFDEDKQRQLVKETFKIIASDNFRKKHIQYFIENVLVNNFNLRELKELRNIFLSLPDEESTSSASKRHYDVLLNQLTEDIVYNLIPSKLAKELNGLGMNIFIPRSQTIMDSI